MNKQQEQLEDLREIRNLMERSSRFLALSGIAGILVGIFALAGVAAAYIHLELSIVDAGYDQLAAQSYGFLFADFVLVLILSLATGILFAKRKAKKQELLASDATAFRLLINLFIPLAAGGLFCLILWHHGYIGLMAPVTLIFYGLALINGSKYAIDDIRYLGIIELVIGLLAAFFMHYGLLFWAAGFGLMHIVYGLLIYFKYEK